jgi:hypothetical protein
VHAYVFCEEQDHQKYLQGTVERSRLLLTLFRQLGLDLWRERYDRFIVSRDVDIIEGRDEAVQLRLTLLADQSRSRLSTSRKTDIRDVVWQLQTSENVNIPARSPLPVPWEASEYCRLRLQDRLRSFRAERMEVPQSRTSVSVEGTRDLFGGFQCPENDRGAAVIGAPRL